MSISSEIFIQTCSNCMAVPKSPPQKSIIPWPQTTAEWSNITRVLAESVKCLSYLGTYPLQHSRRTNLPRLKNTLLPSNWHSLLPSFSPLDLISLTSLSKQPRIHQFCEGFIFKRMHLDGHA